MDGGHWQCPHELSWSQRELRPGGRASSLALSALYSPWQRLPRSSPAPCGEGHQFVLACDCSGQMVGISRPQSPLTFEQCRNFNNERTSFEYVQMRRYISIHFISSLICESNIDPELSVMGSY